LAVIITRERERKRRVSFSRGKVMPFITGPRLAVGEEKEKDESFIFKGEK
jgi:hypothetical protein